MRKHKLFIGLLILTALLAILAVSGFGLLAARPQGVRLARAEAPDILTEELASASAADSVSDPLVLSYAAKFVCLESLPPGSVNKDIVPPIVSEKTDVLVHNPNDFPVTFYRKAVRAGFADSPPITPGAWKQHVLNPDFALRMDCDDVARLLTGNPNATFIGTYGIGVRVEGFVVIGIGPQTIPGTNIKRYGTLDVTAEYARSSEVLKKDIHYQPWWWYWYFPLPWKLGYAYDRIIPVQIPAVNIDCRAFLYDELNRDVAIISDPEQQSIVHRALDIGESIYPPNTQNLSHQTDPALVALIGNCEKVSDGTSFYLNVSYVLLSNKAPTDPAPGVGQAMPSQVVYPWIPGKWYDLSVVVPQNTSIDIEDHFRQWHRQRWIDAGEPAAIVDNAMIFYFPYWCGWGYWWWWNVGDCTDIGVGEGESLDVEQVNPARISVSQWPPP